MFERRSWPLSQPLYAHNARPLNENCAIRIETSVLEKKTFSLIEQQCLTWTKIFSFALKMPVEKTEVISNDAIEQVLERVHLNKKQICDALQEGYTKIDDSMLYENHVAACKKIVEPSSESVSATPAFQFGKKEVSDEMDEWESLFGRLDKIDRDLTEPKAVAKTNSAKSISKLNRYGSTTNLNKTVMTASNDTTMFMNTTMQMPMNQTIMSGSRADISMMPPPPMPAQAPPSIEAMSVVSESMLADFNNMKVASFDELQKKRIGPELREFFAKFEAILEKLKEFFEKIQSAMENQISAASDADDVDPLPELTDEFNGLLNKLASAVIDARVLEKDKNLFGDTDLVELKLPLSEHLTEILQKYNHG